VKRLPLFNGVPFHEFVLPDFEDFDIEVDKRKPKTSYKAFMLPYFDEAKMAYPACVEHEKQKNQVEEK
jgi:hypothetical protein